MGKRGSTGIRGMARIFKQMDSYDGNRRLDRQEFYIGLKELGAEVSKKEAEVCAFDPRLAADGLLRQEPGRHHRLR